LKDAKEIGLPNSFKLTFKDTKKAGFDLAFSCLHLCALLTYLEEKGIIK
jgi:hypothetical protein